MKKNLVTYIVSCIALILARILVYSLVEKMSLMAFVVINLVLPALIIIIANGVINYGKESSVKKCLLHAVILAMLSLVINLGATQIIGDQVIDDVIESTQVGSSESIEQELLDELDRQARQKMIEEGLISEDEIIYSEPFISGGEVEGDAMVNGQLTGTWDVQIEKENTLSTVTGAILDILLAFVGGVIGAKLSEKKRVNIS